MIMNKKESIKFLKERDLNRIESTEFYNIFEIIKPKTKELNNFLNKHAKFAIRSTGKNGKFIYETTFTDLVYNYNKFYDINKYQLVESLKQQDDNNLLCQLEIEIDKHQRCHGWISREKGMSMREAVSHPSTAHFYNIDINTIKKYEYASKPIDYILRHGLIGMIVELSYYNVPVGIKNENIIIWECRNY